MRWDLTRLLELAMDGGHEVLAVQEAYLTGVHDGLRLALHLAMDGGLEALEELVERVEEERAWLLAATLGAWPRLKGPSRPRGVGVEG